MAIYDFYNWYTIDDNNINCWRIIVADCDGNHHYESICDLINLCTTHSQQLESDCVVDFLNNLDQEQAWYFLRVDSSHCLEAVELTIPMETCVVKASNDDGTCWYLIEKIRPAWCINISLEWPASDRYLEISCTGPTNITDLWDVSGWIYWPCDNATNAFIRKVMTVQTSNNTIQSECEYKWMWSLYLWWDIDITNPELLPNQSVSHRLVWWLDKYEWDNWLTRSKSVGASVKIRWGWAGNAVTSFKVPANWVYRIWIKGNIRVNPWVQALRLYVVSDNHNIHWCVDCKFGAGNNPLQPMTWNYNETLNEDSDTYVNMWWDTQVYLTEWTAIALWMAVDCAAWTWIQPKVTIFSSWLNGWTYENPVGLMNNRSWTSIQIEYIREKQFDVTF